MIICFICKKPIEEPAMAIKITQKGNRNRVEYLHPKCLKKEMDKATDEYCSNILNKFIDIDKR